jgi:DNA-binding transcriptional MerR regulator
MPEFTITELAREFEITPRTIRFYEDQGILSPTRAGTGGRQRVYSQRDRTRLKLTLRGKRLGLSLTEIKALVDMYESPADTAAQLTRFLAVLQEQRHKLESQLDDLRLTLAEIESHESRAQALLAHARKTPIAVETDDN